MTRRIILACAVVSLLIGLRALAQTTAPERPEGVPKDWILFQARKAFTFWGPADLKEEKVRGIDSYVGKYTSPTLTIGFDFGMFSGEYSGDKYKLEDITVDGRKAVLAKSDGGVGLYVGHVNEDPKNAIRLSIFVSCKPEDAKQAEILLRSLKFGQSNRNGE